MLYIGVVAGARMRSASKHACVHLRTHVCMRTCVLHAFRMHMCMSHRQLSVSIQVMAHVIDACLHAVLPFVLHHPLRPVDAVPWRPWPDHGNDIWSKRRYKSATFCAPWVPPRRCCEFGGCWEACWQAGELTAVSRSMLAAVKEQAKVEKTNNTANKRRRI